ncbi:type 1 fimbrial protein [Acinetobacter lanii]|uniref:Type 1 fimbrial protein n=2 Tax=Acinetobacter lanii TaxID=2715163 RepID=A0A6G8S8G2_9GAMM|nr:type 1 fimbrial protein [Acinetobacter lanii]
MVLGISSSAFAATGTINFTGAVNSTTCAGSVSGGSSGSTNDTVTLPVVSKSDLAAANTTAGKTEFTINLTDGNGNKCVQVVEGANKFAVPYFEYDTGKVNTDGRLKNLQTGGASNVDIQLLNSTEDVIDIKLVGAAQQLSVSADNESYKYYAQYFATNTAGEGEVRGTVTYNIIYK